MHNYVLNCCGFLIFIGFGAIIWNLNVRRCLHDQLELYHDQCQGPRNWMGMVVGICSIANSVNTGRICYAAKQMDSIPFNLRFYLKHILNSCCRHFNTLKDKFKLGKVHRIDLDGNKRKNNIGRIFKIDSLSCFNSLGFYILLPCSCDFF